MASRTTTRASAKPTGGSSGSRTPSSKSTGGNSGNDYNAAEQARLEAARKKRIEENKKYIADIQATNAKVKKTREQIAQAQTLLANAVSGDKYKEYSKYLENQDKWLSQIGDDLNSRGEKAAQNIRGDGEAYTFNKTTTNPDQNNNKNTNKTLSVNTDELQKLVSLLGDINTSARSIDTKVSGISNDSSKLGIQNSYNAKDNSRNVINSTITLKNKLKQQIQETEKTEKENLNIIGKITDWFNSLFKSSKDEKMKDLDTDEARKEHITVKNIELKNKMDEMDKLVKKQLGTDEARKEHIEIKNKQTNLGKAKELAANKGINTKGKNYKEIVNELAKIYEVPTTKSTLLDEIWDLVIDLDKKTADEKWTYGTSPETNVEGALNTPRKQMQCGTLVSIPLIQAGFLTEEDIRGRINGQPVGGPQFNSPASIRRALMEKDCEKINDPNELKKGDILFYNKGNRLEWAC